jgi:hypothetical protein
MKKLFGFAVILTICITSFLSGCISEPKTPYPDREIHNVEILDIEFCQYISPKPFFGVDVYDYTVIKTNESFIYLWGNEFLPFGNVTLCIKPCSSICVFYKDMYSVLWVEQR